MHKSSLQFSIFSPYPNLVTEISTKQDGSMKLQAKNYKIKNEKNRATFLRKVKIKKTSLVSALLAQQNIVAIVTKDTTSFIPQVDGLVTTENELYLSVTVADCLPIFFYYPPTNIIGILHAGWKGLDKEIINNAILMLKEKFFINPSLLLAGIGPGIEECHFLVKEDVYAKFRAYKNAGKIKNNTKSLSLKSIAKLQMIENGIKKENIEINNECTYCLKDTYFSYRRDGGYNFSTMMALIGLKSNPDIEIN
jgi:hypothetical protein